MMTSKSCYISTLLSVGHRMLFGSLAKRVENYSETTTKVYYGAVINYLVGTGGSNESVNIRNAHNERVNCLSCL